MPRDQSFGNGRLVRNIVEDLIGRHAVRLSSDHDVTDEGFSLLIAGDLEGIIPEKPTSRTAPGLYL